MHDDAAEVLNRMWAEMAKSPFVMIRLVGSEQHSEPMTAQLDENARGAFWLYASRDNRIAIGGHAMAQFASKGHNLFACIRGVLSEETDPAVIDRHWSNQVAAWFGGGRSDSKLMMLRFDLEDAELWEHDPSLAGTLRMLAGAKIGPEEMGRREKIAL